MSKIVNGIQQIGIGVSNVKEVFNWYRKYLGFDILVFKDEATASLMTRYTAEKEEERIAYLTLNMIGGGGLEIWQFKNRVPEAPKSEIILGDLGINIMKLRTTNLEAIHASLKNHNIESLTEIKTSNLGSHFFFRDPWSNWVQMVEDDYCFTTSKSFSGGVLGVILGVSDMDESIKFYNEFLGFDKVVYNEISVFEDFSNFLGGSDKFRRVLLRRSAKAVGGFGELYGPSEIELVQSLDRKPNKIYKDRLWGDLGFIHLCFDVQGMDAHREDAKSVGKPFTVDSADSFDMGDAAGHFSYVEDPDGTLLEFVETHKVPILKKLGISIDLKKREATKPLPRWIVKALRLHRVKKDL
ncbi:MAG: VOC family protein [Maribacter sp.]